MLANTADTGTLEYNTVDATLWFLHAVDRHVARTGDVDLAAELAPAARPRSSSTTSHGHPLRHRRRPRRRPAAPGRRGLGADLDGRPHRRRPVTPRAGQGGRGQRAVDQRRSPSARRLLDARAPDADRWAARGDRARPRSRAASPRRTAAACYDVVDGPGGDDAALRPNQLLAVSLPHGPLRRATARRVAACRARAADVRSGCARSPPTTRPTGRTTAAARPSATAPTTRARSGRG